MLNADALFSNTGYIGTIRASNMHAGGNVVADGAVIGAGVYFGTSAPYTDVSKAISSIGTYSASGGQITIPTTRLDGTAGPDINFNIAATQYFIDERAAAELRGWNAACDMVTKVGNTIYGPQKNSYGNYEQKYSANYTSSSYSASTHSHSDAWMKIDGITGTYWNDAIVTLNSFSGNVQFNSGFDSYYPSSYSPSSFSWTTY
jgi:hypothetical protein